jgi:hypothetical protein
MRWQADIFGRSASFSEVMLGSRPYVPALGNLRHVPHILNRERRWGGGGGGNLQVTSGVGDQELDKQQTHNNFILKYVKTTLIR